MKRNFIFITASTFIALCMFGGIAWIVVDYRAKKAEAVALAAKEAAEKRAADEAFAAKKKAADEAFTAMKLSMDRQLAEAERAGAIMRAKTLASEIARELSDYFDRHEKRPATDVWHKAVVASARERKLEIRKRIKNSTYYTPAEKKKTLADMDMEPLSLVDPWGNEYRLVYRKSFDITYFDVVSNGPDGEADTRDDIFERGKL